MHLSKEELKERLLDQFKEFGNGDVYLVFTTLENYLDTRNILIAHLVDNLDLKGVYFSLNKSYSVITKELNKLGIDTSKLFFVDCVSKTNQMEVPADNCYYIKNASSLQEMLYLAKTMSKNWNYDFLIDDDSLSSSLVYNNPAAWHKIYQFVGNKIKALNSRMIYLEIESDQSKTIASQLSHFCTKIIPVFEK